MPSEDTDKSFVEIDQDRLDKEWLQQPKLYLEYAEKLAEANDALSKRKSALEVVEAELSLDIRLNPFKYKFTKVKPNNDEVEATLKLQEPYKLALEKYNRAQYRVDILKAAVTALDHKKRALENLVVLHGQSYFASPRAKGEAAREFSEEAGKKSARAGLKKGK